MTIDEEFLEILRILAEEPQPSATKCSGPQSDRSVGAVDSSCESVKGKRKEAAS